MTTATKARRFTIDTEWFVRRIGETVGSQVELARLMKTRTGEQMTKATVWKTLTGRRALGASEAAQMAVHLGVPVGEILRHAGGARFERPLPTASVPLVGTVDGEGHVDAEWKETNGDQVIAPPHLPAGALAVVVEAGTYQGTILYLGAQAPRPAKDRFCVVKLERGPTVCAYALRRGTVTTWPGMCEVEADATAMSWVRPVLWQRLP
jgi:hypothetical protein